MLANIVLAALFGGLAFFVWSAISWMALPWHRGQYMEFADEDAVAAAIVANAPTSGLYGLPETPKAPPGATAEQAKAAEEALWAKMQSGPIVTAVVTRGGFGSLPRMLFVAFANSVLVAAAFAWILAQVPAASYFHKVAVVSLLGATAALACRVPDWNWHKFPFLYALVGVADLAIGWALAGLVIAHFIKPAPG
ncbi:MAG: hypothetical protein L0Z55_06685 [Planctomycetes bacterium]|nr:hypothetical protein [Planctomycetota bacterium]